MSRVAAKPSFSSPFPKIVSIKVYTDSANCTAMSFRGIMIVSFSRKPVMSRFFIPVVPFSYRATILGEIAEKVWPYPALADHELAPYRQQEGTAPQYTLADYQHLNAYNRILFEKLNKRILNLSTYIKREFKKLYIAYKIDTNFVDVVIQSSRLRLAVNMKFADVIDPKGLCKDTTGIGRWGNGDVEIGFSSLDQLDDVMEIVEQSFRLQEVE